MHEAPNKTGIIADGQQSSVDAPALDLDPIMGPVIPAPAEFVGKIIARRDEIWRIPDIEEARAVFVGHREAALALLDDDKRASIEPVLTPPQGASYPELLQFYKKKALLLYQVGITPPDKIRLTAEERQVSIRERLNELHGALTEAESNAIIFSMGSYAKGKLNNGFSDLDLVIILDTDDEEEMDKWQQGALLSEAGIHALPIPNQDWEKFRTGEGDLLRIFGGDDDFNEIEAHVLSLRAARALPSIYPGKIERVVPKGASVEHRTAFDGHVELLPKPGDVVHSFTEFEGRVYRGFYPEALLVAQTLYDPADKGRDIVEGVWYSNLKAFLHHQGGYEYDETGKVIGIKDEFKDPELFISTLYYKNPEDYSFERWIKLLERHRRAMKRIGERIIRKVPAASEPERQMETVVDTTVFEA